MLLPQVGSSFGDSVYAELAHLPASTTSAITTTEHALELRSDHLQLSSRDGDL
jgi:hypothetical protein